MKLTLESQESSSEFVVQSSEIWVTADGFLDSSESDRECGQGLPGLIVQLATEPLALLQGGDTLHLIVQLGVLDSHSDLLPDCRQHTLLVCPEKAIALTHQAHHSQDPTLGLDWDMYPAFSLLPRCVCRNDSDRDELSRAIAATGGLLASLPALYTLNHFLAEACLCNQC